MTEAHLYERNKRSLRAQNMEHHHSMEPSKKRKTETKSKQKSPSMVLHLTPSVILGIWKDKNNIRIQIDDGERKINIPPNVWRTLHSSAEAITLLLSFVEGQGGIVEYYDAYYKKCQGNNTNSDIVTNRSSSETQSNDLV